LFNIKIKAETESFVTEEYGTFGWPIKYFDKAQNLNEEYNYISINLRIDDNTKPILFIENTDLLIENNASRFLDDKKLINGISTDWSKEITLKFPTIVSESVKENIPYYLKINYFRQEHNELSPDSVIKNEFYFNNAFASIDLPNLADNEYTFQQVHNPNLNYISGKLTDITNEFSYVGENGAQWDNNRIVFYNKAFFKKKSTGNFFDSSTNTYSNLGFNLEGDFNKMSFLSNDIQINKNTIQEVVSSGVYQTINIIDIIKKNGFPNTYEDLLCLGITQAEFTTLKNLTGFTNKHHRYIYIQEITGSPFEDKDEKRFRKFELKVQGLNYEGNRLIIAPAPPIYVYTQNGLVFTTKNFAEQEISQQSETYQRNYEEKMGLKIKPYTTKTYEDYFIGDINPNMKVEVDGFINTLATIPNDSNAFASIRTLVEDSAKDIWDEAVRYVQANANTTPDDRPLYWARIKMQVALKSHLYFIGQHTYSSDIQGSEVNSGSDLEKIIQIFEEKSRNYKGVDFSLAPVGKKKILITGFDPFKLWININQSNPSGVCALFLHNKILGDGFVQTKLFPVRYRDFDGVKSQKSGRGNGVVENYVADFIGHNTDQADIIITISQNQYGNYNLDRFATINRGGGFDNLKAVRMPNTDSVILNSSEQDLIWLETTLPKAMAMNGGASQQADNWKHFTVYAQHYSLLNEDSLIPNSNYKNSEYNLSWNNFFDNFKPKTPDKIFTTNKKPDNLFDSNNKKKMIIDGSGGNYLSNEIFYRVALERERRQKENPNQPKFPTGHFHIASIQYSNSEFNDFRDLTDRYIISYRTVYDELTKLLKTVEERITLGVEGINDLF
jgi:hypothetical protein